MNPQDQRGSEQSANISPKYKGIIRVRDRAQPLTDRFAPTAEINIKPSGVTLTGEFMGMSRADYHNVRTGQMMFQTRRAEGTHPLATGHLRNMDVVANGVTVARVVIDGCLTSRLSLVVGNESQLLEGKAMDGFIFYRADGMNIRFRLLGQNGAEVDFDVDDERWLYPLMAVAHHLWCKAWA
jgi:hypothetical protein